MEKKITAPTTMIAIFALVIIMLVAFAVLTKKSSQDSSSSQTTLDNLTLPQTSRVKIGEQVYDLEIVDTPESRRQGLSGRTELTSDGMLFIFEEENYHSFWMKDMKFNLDFIWMNAGKVVEITTNVPAPLSEVAQNQLPIYSPSQPVLMMLEVMAGSTPGIKVGDTVELLER